MVPGMRVSGKHGDYVNSPESRRKSRERVYGYVIEAKENNRYLIRFDNNIEKECFSNTLKIEQDAAAVPPSESKQVEVDAAVESEKEDVDEESASEDEAPEAELAIEHGVVNIGDINESADVSVNDSRQVEVESRQNTYQNRLRAKRKVISELVGETVAMKSSGNEIIWEVITNHTTPEEKKEVSDARKKQWVELGYNEIKTLMEAEKFVDPTTVSDDGTSNLAIPLRPKSIDYCTVFVKLWLKLSFNYWSKTFEKFNDCISAHNEQQPKNIKEFTRSEFLTCFSLFIGAVVFSVSGARL